MTSIRFCFLLACALWGVVRLPAATLNVQLSILPAGSVVNLTQEGPLDWIHWGLHTETSIDRKGSVSPQISDFEAINEGGDTNAVVYVYQYGDNFNGYSWSDGIPTMRVTNTTTGVWTYGVPNIGSGFRFTVPASTEVKMLKVYVGAYAGRGRFNVRLSDGSAPAYVNSSIFNMRNGQSGVYAISFAAASAGQTLIVTYTLQNMTQPDANVTLQAAALSAAGANNVPFVILTNPAEGSSFSSSSALPLSAMATDADGSVSKVEFYSGGNLLGESLSSPYQFLWQNPPIGKHELIAKAIDNGGATGESKVVTVYIVASGGTLSASRASSPSSVDLTVDGPKDWAHWGALDATTFTHKTSGGGQISTFTTIGSNNVSRFTDNITGFSWNDGAPIPSTNGATTGVFITGLRNGFQISAPADDYPRTLKVYAGLYGSRGNFQAYLSDFSASAFVDTSVSNVFGNAYSTYTITYAAASPGQRVIVRYLTMELYDFDFGNVTLAAAALSGNPPLRLLHPLHLGDKYTFSFQTHPGSNYLSQFTPSLDPKDWQTFSFNPGNGEIISVTNELDSSAQRFYRVIEQ